MKRLLLCILLLAVGFAGGTGIRFQCVWRSAYCRGYMTALDRFQRAAVREGHGRWERQGDAVGFRWNEIRPALAPSTSVRIPGIE